MFIFWKCVHIAAFVAVEVLMAMIGFFPPALFRARTEKGRLNTYRIRKDNERTVIH